MKNTILAMLETADRILVVQHRDAGMSPADSLRNRIRNARTSLAAERRHIRKTEPYRTRSLATIEALEQHLASLQALRQERSA